MRGTDLYHIISWLYLYSFLGWLWESAYVSIKEKKLVNRGFVTGPVCSIYGVGAVSVYLILKPLEGNFIAIYFGGVIVATVLEYLTAVCMEHFFHTGWWDYSDKKWNFQGRICLGSSVAWGFFALLVFAVIQPFAEMVVGWYSVSIGHVLVIVFTILYAVDFGFAVATAIQLGNRLAQVEKIMMEFSEHLQKTKIYSSALEFQDRLEPYRKSLNRSNIKEKMSQYQEALVKRIEHLELSEYREITLEKWKALNEKFNNAVLKGNWNSRRLMKAYPNLSKASKLRRNSMKDNKRNRRRHRKIIKK